MKVQKHRWLHRKRRSIHVLVSDIQCAKSINSFESLQPALNASSDELLKYLNGKVTSYPNMCMVWVDVRDVALAHLIAYENPAASGRLFAAPYELSYKELTDYLAKEYPNAPVPRV